MNSTTLATASPSEHDYLFVQTQPPIGIITLDHPPVNALNVSIIQQLERCIDTFLHDDTIRVIVITGAGKFFSAGADLVQVKQLLDDFSRRTENIQAFIGAGQAVFTKIEQASKPVIAALNGPSLGGGLELAMACHIRVCSEQARLGQPEINLGLIPGWGGTVRLARLVGKSQALELILSGETVSAQKACELGLVNKIVSSDSLLKESLALAYKIASKPRLPVIATLEAIGSRESLQLKAGLAIEMEQFVRLSGTQDANEGINAFLDKRSPKFLDK